MEFSKRMIPALFLLVLLVLASGMEAARPAGLPVVIVEMRTCESKSYTFKGLCITKHNCNNACLTEGFLYGKCRGLRRRCFCTTYC